MMTSTIFFKYILFTLFLSVSAHLIPARADLESKGEWCGTLETPEWLAEDRKRLEEAHTRVLPRQSAWTVDTYFHIVANSTRPQDGYLSVSCSHALCPELTHSPYRTKPSAPNSSSSTHTSPTHSS